MANSYANYSIEELISMRASINAAISEKERQVHNKTLKKVLKALKTMAENYPYEDAFNLNDEYFTWEELYKYVREQN